MFYQVLTLTLGPRLHLDTKGRSNNAELGSLLRETVANLLPLLVFPLSSLIAILLRSQHGRDTITESILAFSQTYLVAVS